MTTPTEAYRRALQNRLRAEYTPPHLIDPAPLNIIVGKLSPEALLGPPHPANAQIVELCDHAMEMIREYKLQEYDEVARRNIISELLVICEMLEALGYKATAGLGHKQFLWVARRRRHGTKISDLIEVPTDGS